MMLPTIKDATDCLRIPNARRRDIATVKSINQPPSLSKNDLSPHWPYETLCVQCL